jgi:cold shock CspA family protein
LDAIQHDIEIEYTKEKAKIEFEKGNYSLARIMFETLWDKSNKDNVYLLYDYGKVLRKTQENIKFIEICRELNSKKNIISNKWINSLLCWCLYDAYIKNYFVDDKENFNDFLKRAEYIINNCVQKDGEEHYKTPFVLTIRKVVKIYNDRPSKNYKEIVKWLSYLDPDRLSEEDFSFQDENGQDRELASPKEFYYQNMAKALEKTEKYEQCILICETAIKQIHKFHYRNNTWFRARMYYSKCMLHENIDEAIKEYKELAYRENYWFMYHKLSQICFRYNKLKEALLYACKAFGCRFEHEKMVNLMLDTALLWQAIGINAKAKLFFQASAFYRKRQGWPLSEELQYSINIFEINAEEKPDIRAIQDISRDYVVNIEGQYEKLEGHIDNILPHGGSGFIKPSNAGPNVYFNMNDVFDKRLLTKGDRVQYELSKGHNEKMRAVKIKLRS